MVKIFETYEEKIARIAGEGSKKLEENASPEVLEALGIEKDLVEEFKESTMKQFLRETFESTIHDNCSDSQRERLITFFESQIDVAFSTSKFYTELTKYVKPNIASALNEESNLKESYIDICKNGMISATYDQFEKMCFESVMTEDKTPLKTSFDDLMESYSDLGIVGNDGSEQAVVCSAMSTLVGLQIGALKPIFKNDRFAEQFMREYADLMENPFA